MTLESVQDKPDGSLLGLTQVFEREDAQRPVCYPRIILGFEITRTLCLPAE